jgi:hypothetical protein
LHIAATEENTNQNLESRLGIIEDYPLTPTLTSMERE